MPEKPRDSELIFSAMIRRTVESFIGWPMPAACDSTMERCSSSSSSAAILVLASRPKPVLMP
ncbi:hypothetical protein D3C86_2147840 [compost metagenome]